RNTPATIATALLDAGHPDCAAHVFEHLGGAAERHTACRLAELPGQAFAALNVLVLLRPDAIQRARAGFGLPESCYAHRGGQITKAEVRAVSLSKLRLFPGAIVWDVGAGCGSVSVEAAGLSVGGRVYAVERDPVQLALLEENVARAATAVVVVPGDAPRALAGLPDPDGVFLGGSGGQLAALLACATNRLRPGGRVVSNFATLEHLGEALRYLRGRGWTCETVQLTVARGSEVAGLTRLAALHPVFILAAWRSPEQQEPRS